MKLYLLEFRLNNGAPTSAALVWERAPHKAIIALRARLEGHPSLVTGVIIDKIKEVAELYEGVGTVYVTGEPRS